MSSASSKATMQDTAEISQGSEGEEYISGSEEPHPGGGDEDGVTEASQPSPSKRQHKTRSKVAKALNKIRGKEIPQSIRIPPGDPDAIRAVLEQLRIMDVLEGKAGVAGRGGKATDGHKVDFITKRYSSSLPFPGEEPSSEDGYIEPAKAIEDGRREPYPLPKDFEWSILDVDDSKQIKEVYDLLSLNYVEDDSAAFRFQYSAEFLEWTLKSPGYFKEWHVGVRVSSNKKLVAFISGVPTTLRVRGNVFRASEINFLCVHKKLRSKRLAPVLIKEVTRQVHLQGISRAIDTVGAVLPTPVSTCRYYHRPLNIPKLVNVEFTCVPRNMTLARMIREYKTDATPRLPGLREMEEKDIPRVADLFAQYMQRFNLAPIMTVDEIRHLFLGGRGDVEQPCEKYRRPKQVLWAHVVEDPGKHRVTDFFSFYSLPFTIINRPRPNLLEAAYLFYYASDVAFKLRLDESNKLKTRLVHLIGDALIIANQANFDVFNAVTLMDNVTVLDDFEGLFGAGDSLLNLYLYNWRTAPLAGVNAIGDVEAGRGVGVVMV
ncbi:N-myristoyl transferase [Pisolithus croceorrhizus]|nr:N-myristoyl transferase [Pisolithus croceorrhizus]